MTQMTYLISQKWKLAFKVLPIVGLILFAKFYVHYQGWEFLTLNSLFGAIISANVFLIGFLISGVLVDYKESEKLPSELACSLEVIIDEGTVISKNKKSKAAQDMIMHVHDLAKHIILWLHRKESVEVVLGKITGLNDYFFALEKFTQANFIVRIKNEQHTLRKLVTRIHAIRETSFNSAGYAIAEIISFVLCIGLIFTNIVPYYESIFFVAFVTFILIYMVLLIKDLDNPFGYSTSENYADEVSLKPLYDLQKRISQ